MAAYEHIETAAASGGAKLISKKVYDTVAEEWKYLQGFCPMVYVASGWEHVSDANPLPVVFANAEITVQTADGQPIEVTGTVFVDQGDEPWSVRLLDGNGEILPGATDTPPTGARGLVVRPVGPHDQGSGNNDPEQGWAFRLTTGLNFVTSTTVGDAFCIDVREQFPQAAMFLDDNVTEVPVLVATGSIELRMLTIENPGTTKAYLQIFDASDSSAVTLGSTPPLLSLFVPAGGAYELPMIPLKFTNGLVIAGSTTAKGDEAPTDDLVVNAAYY